MRRGPEATNESFSGGLRGHGLVFAFLSFVAAISCASRAPIEPTSPTPAPPTATSATAPSPEVQVPPTPAEGTTSATPEKIDPATIAKCSSDGTPLSRLCCLVGRSLGGAASGVAVAVGPPSSGTAPARPAEMSTHIAGCVARAIGHGARALGSALSLEQARGATPPARKLIYVTPEIAHGWVRLEAAPYVLEPSHGVLAGGGAVEASAELDGELGAYLPRIPITAARIERDSASADVVALACGNVAATEQTEIVAVGRHKVQIGRAGDGRFSVRAEASWASLSPVAPSPLREPIGGAVVVRGRGVLAGISDRADGFLLSPALAKVRSLGAPVPLGGDWGCAGRSGIALGAPKSCEPGGNHLDDATAFDAFASGNAVDAEGRAIAVLATRDPMTRRVTLRRGTSTATLPAAGSALAVADLDLDGQPEIVASVDTDRPEEDAIVVSTWARDGAVSERLRVPVKDGVRALAVCPVEDVRMAPIVAATPGGLWIVR